MILKFKHKGLELFYKTDSVKGIQLANAKKLGQVLRLLNVAKSPSDLALPGLRLHPLKVNLEGHWSITISGNWRLTFIFVEQNIHIVDYQDYH